MAPEGIYVLTGAYAFVPIFLLLKTSALGVDLQPLRIAATAARMKVWEYLNV